MNDTVGLRFGFGRDRKGVTLPHHGFLVLKIFVFGHIGLIFCYIGSVIPMMFSSLHGLFRNNSQTRLS